MGQVRGGRFYESFDEKMYGKSLSIVFFLEATLKRRLTTTEIEIK